MASRLTRPSSVSFEDDLFRRLRLIESQQSQILKAFAKVQLQNEALLPVFKEFRHGLRWFKSHNIKNVAKIMHLKQQVKELERALGS